MGTYKYAGGGPQDDQHGGIIRPGDLRDFDDDPGWGAWELVPEPAGGSVSDSPVPPTPEPVPGADSQPPADDAATAADSAPTPDSETQPAKGA